MFPALPLPCLRVQLTQLTYLALSGTENDGPWPEAWPEGTSYGEQLALQPFSLASFQQLEALTLNVEVLQPSSCAQLSALTALRSVAVGIFDAQVPATLWSSLARMPRLEQLTVDVQTPEGGACTIPAAGWQVLRGCPLRSLEIKHQYIYDQRGEPSLLTACLPACLPG